MNAKWADQRGQKSYAAADLTPATVEFSPALRGRARPRRVVRRRDASLRTHYSPWAAERGLVGPRHPQDSSGPAEPPLERRETTRSE
jgi:hypothetical protein